MLENEVIKAMKTIKEWCEDRIVLACEKCIFHDNCTTDICPIGWHIPEEKGETKMNSVEWIPVTERLPERDDMYLITYNNGDGPYFMDFDKGRFEDNEHVIAWAERSKPYSPPKAYYLNQEKLDGFKPLISNYNDDFLEGVKVAFRMFDCEFNEVIED